MKLKISIFGFFLLLLGCTAEKEGSSDTQQSDIKAVVYSEFPAVKTDNVFAYECERDSLQFASHETPDSAWVFLSDGAVKLIPMKSASGAKYGSEEYLYWSKGEDALLQIPNEPLRNCRTLPQEKSWQAAKIRGVDFRAQGQEPGWLLEITDKEQIKYVGNYGEDSVSVATPDPKVIKNTGKTEYRVEADENELIIEIENKQCIDSMKWI